MRFVYISNDGEAEAGKGDDAGGAGQVEEDYRGQHLSQGEDLEGGKARRGGFRGLDFGKVMGLKRAYP